MPRQPLAEVFGFPIDNMSEEAQRHRKHRLCPFNNKVANCTKDKASDPLGVCSVLAEAPRTPTYLQGRNIASMAQEDGGSSQQGLLCHPPGTGGGAEGTIGSRVAHL